MTKINEEILVEVKTLFDGLDLENCFKRFEEILPLIRNSESGRGLLEYAVENQPANISNSFSNASPSNWGCDIGIKWAGFFIEKIIFWGKESSSSMVEDIFDSIVKRENLDHEEHVVIFSAAILLAWLVESRRDFLNLT